MTSKSILISCQWDWCRLTFSNLDDLQLHVKHDHVWPMKPMRKSQIALLRRIDAIDGSQNSSDSCREPVAALDSLAVGRGKLSDRMQSSRTQREAFRTFRHLSSPAEMASVRNLPPSPNLDSLIALRGPQSLPAAVERFEQTHNHKSSTSSQDAVEQQLTQEDEFDGQLMGPSHVVNINNEKDLTDNKFADTDLQWPASDDEVDALQPLPEDIHDSDSSPIPNQSLASSSIGTGKRFHSGFLELSSGRGNASIASTPNGSTNVVDPQSHELTQSFALQTQPPYFSQSVDASQSQ